jgi:hypothetical protein
MSTSYPAVFLDSTYNLKKKVHIPCSSKNTLEHTTSTIDKLNNPEHNLYSPDSFQTEIFPHTSLGMSMKIPLHSVHS